MEDLFIEIRGIYDGWSVYVDPQGYVYNRWDRGDTWSRWAATEDWLDEHFPDRKWKPLD